MNNSNNIDFTETSSLFNKILNISSGHSVIAVSRDSKVILWNKSCEYMFGFNPSEMLDHKFPQSFFTYKASEILLKYIKNPSLSEDLNDIELTAQNKKGEKFPVSVSVIIGKNATSKFSSSLIIIRDLNKLRLNEEFKDTIFEISKHVNSPNTIDVMSESILDSLYGFSDIKSAYFCFIDSLNSEFKISFSKGLSKHCTNHICQCCVSDGSATERKNSCLYAFQNKKITSTNLLNHTIKDYVLDTTILDNDSHIIHIPLLTDNNLIGLLHIITRTPSNQLLLDQPEILSLISSLISDGIVRRRLITEIKEYADNLEKMVKVRTNQLREKDAQLVQSGKLATLGELATGVAHEINQPLGGISLIAQGLLMAKSRNKLNDDMLKDKLDDILKQVNRINKIIKHLKTFARQTKDIITKVHIKDPINDVFTLIGQQLINSGIETVISIDENLPPVKGEHNRLEQVFLNILSNSKDALLEMESGIKKFDFSDEVSNPKLKKHISIKAFNNASVVQIEIKDNGIGIPPQVKDKIFEPFFTTKEVGKGTGLGLSISYGIIKEFGGNIHVESEEYLGTKFTITLPIAKE